MVSTLDRIRTTRILAQGPPAAGLTAAEKQDILDDIDALEADFAALEVDLIAAEASIVTLTADLGEARQGWLNFFMDGGGSTLPTGVRFRAVLPADYTITPDPVDGQVWRVGLDQSGAISLDLWMGTHGSYPPTTSNRISGTVGTNNPRVTSGSASQSSSLTNWTTALVGGRWLLINVASVTNAQQCALALYVVRS